MFTHLTLIITLIHIYPPYKGCGPGLWAMQARALPSSRDPVSSVMGSRRADSTPVLPTGFDPVF